MSTERTPAEVSAQKRAFAAAFVRHKNPLRAANEVAPGNFPLANSISVAWPHDPEVQAFIDAIRADVPDELDLLADKADVARRLLEIADSAPDAKDKIAAYKAYAELRGFTKPDKNPPKNDAPKVMAYRDFGTDDDWEARTEAQQAELAAKGAAQ